MVEIKEDKITCPFLKEALDRAAEEARLDMQSIDVPPYIYNDTYGNFLVGKGTGRGKGVCEFCQKKVQVIRTAEKAEGLRDFEGQAVNAFAFIGSGMNIKVGGEQCQE